MLRRMLAFALVLAALAVPVACTTTEQVGSGDEEDSTTTTSGDAPVTTTTVALDEYDVEAQDCESTGPRDGTQELIDQFVAAAGITEEGEPYEGCARYQDETETVALEVPESWEYVAPVELEGGIASLQVRPRVSSDPGDPVVGVAARQTDTPTDLDTALVQLGTSTTNEARCVPQETEDYADGVFTGRVKMYVDCPDGRAWLFVAANPDDGSPYTIAVLGQVVTLADVEVLQHVLDTYAITS